MSTSLIHAYLPEYKMRQIDRIRVKTSPTKTWEIVRSLDTQSLPLSRFLFNLRSIPDRLTGRDTKPLKPRTSRIEDFTGPGKGFQILQENPGQEIVIGSIGKFWKFNIEWASMDSNSFKKFSTPGFGKLAWNLRVDPDDHGGSWISWDLRVTATDDDSWRNFRRYWFVIGRFSHLLRRSALVAFHRQLGGKVSEERLRLPADELIPSPKYQKTMSITIEAPPRKIWPWLVQMGCRRGGWYSIDSLDNGGTPSAMQVIPGLQAIRVGQILPWKPKGGDGFTVLKIVHERTFVLGTGPLLRGPHQPSDDFNDTWAFVLEPIGKEATRLITRVRADYWPRLRMTLLSAWLRLAHRLMEYTQLVNLKRRIENPNSSSPILLKEAPNAQFRSQVAIDINATPERCLKAFHEVTPRDMPLAWLLGQIRYLPARLLGRKQARVDQDEPFGKRLIESGSLELSRNSNEVVIVSAGKYHQIIDQEFFHFETTDEFRRFHNPEYQKLLISVRAEPLGKTRSKLILEHWTWALSDKSHKKFARYWKLIRPTGNFVSRILLRAAKKRAERDLTRRRIQAA